MAKVMLPELFKFRFVASLDDVPVGAEICDAEETEWWRKQWAEAIDSLAQPDYDDVCRRFGQDPAESRCRAQQDIDENGPMPDRPICIKVRING